MPISSNRKRKLWFRPDIASIRNKLNLDKTQKDEDDIRDWKSLSPNKPPLPFLLPKHSSDKGKSIKNFDSMTSIDVSPSFSHSLYPILESSETSASSGIRKSHSIEKYDQPSSSSHPVTSEKVLPKPFQTHTSPSSANIPVKEEYKTNQPLVNYIPLFEWPTHALPCEPQFDSDYQFNETKSRAVFTEMIVVTYRLFQKATYYPKEMHLVFNNDDSLRGITFIMQDGTREDYLELGGSLQYLAPELAISSSTQYEPIEVWSLGVSLFRMLIGKYPFDSDGLSDKELLNRMARTKLDIPKQISEDARDLIQKMLSPRHSRVSLNSVQSHPWLEEPMARQELGYTPTNDRSKVKRAGRFVLKALRFIMKGPYPPPASYYDLAASNRTNSF